MLDDENLVGKENVVDANVNGVIDGDCFINFPLLSNKKGFPKQKRMKDWRELGKQYKTCGLCKHVGHIISMCPEKETCTPHMVQKKKKGGKLVLQVKWDWIQYFVWNVR